MNYPTSSSRILPCPMTYHSMGLIKREIFVYGANDSLGSLPDEFWQYDIHLKSWLNVYKDNGMSKSCYFSEIVVAGEWLYFIGCGDNHFDDRKIVIARFDSVQQRWEFLADLSAISENSDFIPCSVHSMFYYNNSLYIFAEIRRYLPFNLIFRYSIFDKSWGLVEQKGKIQKITESIAGSVFENRYYCFGDTKIFTSNVYHNIHIFDLKTHEWSHKKTYPYINQYPSDRIKASISFNETHGFLSGGQCESQEILDDLWSIDLCTLKWNKFKFTLENKIMGHTSAIYDNSTLFLFGGIIEDIKVNKLQQYIIEPISLYKLSLHVLWETNKKESELGDLPISIRQDIFTQRQ